MKRIDLIKILLEQDCELIRHGARHDWYQNKQTGMCQPVPRHREIKEYLAKKIIRLLGSEADEV